MKQLRFAFLVFFLSGFYVFAEDKSVDSRQHQPVSTDTVLSVAEKTVEDSSDDSEGVIKKEEKLWKTYIKNSVAENVLFSVSATEEKIGDNKNLLGVYHYDNNKILHKTTFTGNKVKVPLSVIHSNFVKLLQVGKKNIYVSSLFSVDRKCMYFIAKHLSDGYVMFLFSLPLDFFPNENFILFDEKGQTVLNVGFPLVELRNIENLLKNNLNNLDTLDDNFDSFSIIESSSLMYFYTK